jgi:hypothetical protein
VVLFLCARDKLITTPTRKKGDKIMAEKQPEKKQLVIKTLDKTITIKDIKYVKVRIKSEPWIGYQITLSTGQTLRILIDEIERCCEGFSCMVHSVEDAKLSRHESLKEQPLFQSVLTHVFRSFRWGRSSSKTDNHDIISTATAVLRTYNPVNQTEHSLYFTVWNQHNGYYAHDILLENDQGKIDRQSL